jgi:hypothetical protein
MYILSKKGVEEKEIQAVDVMLANIGKKPSDSIYIVEHPDEFIVTENGLTENPNRDEKKWSEKKKEELVSKIERDDYIKRELAWAEIIVIKCMIEYCVENSIEKVPVGIGKYDSVEDARASLDKKLAKMKELYDDYYAKIKAL